MKCRRAHPFDTQEAGFTLLELILASAISALVLGILAVCMSFALRAWESQQNRKQVGTPPFVDLMKTQLSELDTTPVSTAEGPKRIFAGASFAISFVTAHSVKAISKGAPVVARYIYAAPEKTLYYCEMPFDPYHIKPIREFLEMQPAKGDKSTIRFYPIAVEDFALSYGEPGKDSYSPDWENKEENQWPPTVLVRWKDEKGRALGQVIVLNNPFPIKLQPDTGGGIPGLNRAPGGQ